MAQEQRLQLFKEAEQNELTAATQSNLFSQSAGRVFQTDGGDIHHNTALCASQAPPIIKCST